MYSQIHFVTRTISWHYHSRIFAFEKYSRTKTKSFIFFHLCHAGYYNGSTIILLVLAKLLQRPNNNGQMSVEQFESDQSNRGSEAYVIDPRDEEYAAERLPITGATLDPVKDYLRGIVREPLLTAGQEVELAKRIEAGQLAGKLISLSKNSEQDEDKTDEELQLERWKGRVALGELEWLADDGIAAKQQMIKANLRLVVSIAKRYTGRGMPFLDLIQEGNIGLNRAVEKFDHQKGFKFSTYATWWIRQSVTRAMAEQSRVIRIPVHMHEKISMMASVERQMADSLNRKPTIEELARELGKDPKTVLTYKEYSHEAMSLDMPLGNEDGASIGDIIENTDSIVPVEAAINSAMREAVLTALDTLSERDRGIIAMRYGINDGQPNNLREISEKYGLSTERIRQIIRKTLSSFEKSTFGDDLREYID